MYGLNWPPTASLKIKANQNKLHVQVKHKLGAFHQPGRVIDYLNACFYGNQQQGGGHRGGRQRGGYQGQGGGDGGGDITRYRQFFQEEKNVKKATGFLKGLQVRDYSFLAFVGKLPTVLKFDKFFLDQHPLQWKWRKSKHGTKDSKNQVTIS